MFIGGVSNVGELSSNTALREVSEELGLITDRQYLSNNRLYQCIVCTSYNRCVVDVYGYTIDTQTSSSNPIKWQVEEVAWGAFVPYNIVMAAAHHSITRLQEQNEWSGRYDITTNTPSNEQQQLIKGTNDDALHYFDDDQWKRWDFVPDGLLVWESMLYELQKQY
jgi:hypothetical protein